MEKNVPVDLLWPWLNGRIVYCLQSLYLYRSKEESDWGLKSLDIWIFSFKKWFQRNEGFTQQQCRPWVSLQYLQESQQGSLLGSTNNIPILMHILGHKNVHWNDVGDEKRVLKCRIGSDP